MVELRHLRYFLAVAEELSFTRAAALLHVSQPTLSQQIRALEKSIGAPLFHRGPGGPRLTPAGNALLEPAQRAVVEVIDGIRAVRDTVRSRAGTLRVGFSHGGAGKLTPSILGACRRAIPDVRLVFRELPVGGLYHGLREDRLDIALTRLPLDSERHAWTVLFEEPRLLAVAGANPLADATTVDLKEALALPMPMLAGCPTEVSDYWLLTDHRNGERPDARGGPVESPAEIAHLLEHDPSVVAVAPETLRRMPPLPSMHFLELCGISATKAVVACRQNDRRTTVMAFRQVAATVARRLVAVPATVRPAGAPEGTAGRGVSSRP
ncbi:LysR family transcriptional regulator [Micromonospora sp. NPDC048999]|uniref:LysR family transcriptional regulator n=1 Tax=Micromonospora sp. NPDC048999 TaxID=3155391 RepID=UPI00340B659F